METKGKRLLKLKAASAYMSVSPGVLRRLVQAGSLPFVRVGENDNSPWLLDVQDLDRFIESHKSNPPEFSS